MVPFIDKIKYKLSHTQPPTEATLRDSLVARVGGFVLLISQTITMKKLYVLLAVALLVPSFSFASSSVYGCQPSYAFSPITGQSCTPVVLRDCAAGDLFSSVTGRSCSAPVTVDTPVNIPSQPIPQPTVSQAPSTPPTTDLVQDYRDNLLALNNQILAIKKQYIIDSDNLNHTAGFMAQLQAEQTKLLNDTNAKIFQINMQIQQLYINYSTQIPNLQYPDINPNPGLTPVGIRSCIHMSCADA